MTARARARPAIRLSKGSPRHNRRTASMPSNVPSLALRESLRRDHEIIRVPADGEREVDTAVGQIVHHGPFLGHPDGMMQRHHDAAGADADAAGHLRQDDAGERRIRKNPAESMEMPLGNPDRLEAVVVGEAGALAKQVELVPLELRLLAGEEEQAEGGPLGEAGWLIRSNKKESLAPQLQSLKSTWRKLHFACLKLLSQRLRGLR